MMKNILTAIFFFYSIGQGSGQIITTIAGTGVAGYNGDNMQATAASLNSPYYLTTDAAANIIFSDQNNNRIRKITQSGVIATIAGSGICGFTGNLVHATNAKLCIPMDIVVDGHGNLYVADYGQCRIRKVDTGGAMSVAAGKSPCGFSGDHGPATAAQIAEVIGISMDAVGNVYFADRVCECVRKIDTSGIITTVAGGGSGGLGDGGPATAAKLSRPNGIAIDEVGNLFIIEYVGSRVRKVDMSGIITTVAGTGVHNYSGDDGPATLAELRSPMGVAVDRSGNLYIADAGNDRVRKVSISGVITTIAGDGTPGFSGDGGAATAAKLRRPTDVALDAAGRIYIADEENHRIRRIESTVSVGEMTNRSNGISIYPNPSSGSFTVNINSAMNEPVTISISDITGRKVAEIHAATNTSTPIFLNRTTGIYLLTAVTAHHAWSEKIVVGVED